MTRSKKGSLLVGSIFIVSGILFLLGNLGVFPDHVHFYFFDWRVLLIVIGSVMILTHPNKVGGLVTLAVGSFFLTRDYYGHHEAWYMMKSIFWPALIILIGLMIVARRGQKNGISGRKPEDPTDQQHGRKEIEI